MKKLANFAITAELEKSLIALLFQAGLELYEKDETILIHKPGDVLSEEFRESTKLRVPTGTMGRWAMSLEAKKLKL